MYKKKREKFKKLYIRKAQYNQVFIGPSFGPRTKTKPGHAEMTKTPLPNRQLSDDLIIS